MNKNTMMNSNKVALVEEVMSLKLFNTQLTEEVTALKLQLAAKEETIIVARTFCESLKAKYTKLAVLAEKFGIIKDGKLTQKATIVANVVGKTKVETGVFCLTCNTMLSTAELDYTTRHAIGNYCIKHQPKVGKIVNVTVPVAKTPVVPTVSAPVAEAAVTILDENLMSLLNNVPDDGTAPF